MTTIRPDSIEALAAAVPAHARLRIRGSGTKPGLAHDTEGAVTMDLSALRGVTEYTPAECTFTALAGTPVADVIAALSSHGHALPFDPPLVAAGATLGGTVAAGVNGACRYRFGGIRDFVIGARIVDGCGRVLRGGGAVVKNAAGFLIHQALVGSCGRLGVLAELTFKVFPAPPAHVTMRAEVEDVGSALRMLAAVQAARVDAEALDVDQGRRVHVRIGGFPEALPARVDALRRVLGSSAELLDGAEEARAWSEAGEFTWAPADAALVRVPTSPSSVADLDTAVALAGHARRISVGGHLLWIACEASSLDGLDACLRDRGLVGQVLRGASGRPFLGAHVDSPVEARLKAVLDPDGRF
ncbi:2-hydroxy-acid oxidase [Luteitalea sp. TBR-22]|uniref:FAD-binding protein n=1 Tax=Luteitalea sp. TBR-22 TaxID=2802971 RepID=UPI001AFA1D5F|nr:FAD-binding protein [Luteitalea sp. TBR-22]BCS32470.1 2-hydroxy-acid oxidase [Luteitalea sp. TBR-22]